MTDEVPLSELPPDPTGITVLDEGDFVLVLTVDKAGRIHARHDKLTRTELVSMLLGVCNDIVNSPLPPGDPHA